MQIPPFINRPFSTATRFVGSLPCNATKGNYPAAQHFILLTAKWQNFVSQKRFCKPLINSVFISASWKGSESYASGQMLCLCCCAAAGLLRRRLQVCHLILVEKVRKGRGKLYASLISQPLLKCFCMYFIALLLLFSNLYPDIRFERRNCLDSPLKSIKRSGHTTHLQGLAKTCTHAHQWSGSHGQLFVKTHQHGIASLRGLI